MTGGGGNATPPPESNGGDYLLSLIQKPRQQQTPQQPLPSGSGSTPITPHTLHQQPLVIDPAVAAVGPSVAFPPSPWPSNGYDLRPPWSHPLSPPFPPGFLGFPQIPVNHHSPNQFPGNQRLLPDDLQKLGFIGNANYAIHNLVQHKQPEQHKILFGSLPDNSVQSQDGLLNGILPENSKFSSVKDLEHEVRSRQLGNSNSIPSSSQHWHLDSSEQERRGGVPGGGGGGGGRGKLQHSGKYKSTPPPGFSNKQRGGHWEFGSTDSNSRRRGLDRNVGWATGDVSELSNRSFQTNVEDERLRRLSIVLDDNQVGLSGQLDHPGPPAGSNLHSVSASDVEDSMLELHGEILEEGDGEGNEREDRLRRESEELVDSLLLEGETYGKDEKKQRRNSREKESRVDSRGQHLLSRRMRNFKSHMVCRRDIDILNAHFLSIYESLIPAEDEKAKQKQLLKLLEKLVCEEWPEARLFLYGSCANSFGVSKSDIDVCLAIKDMGISKSEILLKLADILKSDNLQNVQALTRARVPIVKLMDPVTELSCDICINNILAVVNTKLLRDYAQIDSRLRQLAFIVKHWAKSRGVNETYQGTLSSYAYVLMCIHFLQQRKPPILPCLQAMETTYSVTIEDVECAFFDQVEKLQNFGSHNKETIAQLVWGFFNYWAYCHDYANSVISVRSGSIISKREKDWTRRIGNDRHLICIEDPFEISHDLGRVVDKFSIKVLREEFERAAEIMQYNQNPCVALFEPYIPT